MFHVFVLTLFGAPPILVYGYQDQVTQNGAVFLCVKQSDARELAKKTAVERGRDKIKALIDSLSADAQGDFVAITGKPAFLFLTLLDMRRQAPRGKPIDPIGYLLCGSWFPTTTEMEGTILMWFEPGTGYHVRVMEGIEQVRDAVDEFSWLTEAERGYVTGNLARVPTVSNDSKKIINIDGFAARALCEGQLFYILHVAPRE